MTRPLGSTVGRAETRGRKSVYADAGRQVLKVIRRAANPPCGKLLDPVIAIWLPHYEGRHGWIGNALGKRLEILSARSIDRLLAIVRAESQSGGQPIG